VDDDTEDEGVAVGEAEIVVDSEDGVAVGVNVVVVDAGEVRPP